jgi:hypothetical protein
LWNYGVYGRTTRKGEKRNAREEFDLGERTDEVKRLGEVRETKG